MSSLRQSLLSPLQFRKPQGLIQMQHYGPVFKSFVANACQQSMQKSFKCFTNVHDPLLRTLLLFHFVSVVNTGLTNGYTFFIFLFLFFNLSPSFSPRCSLTNGQMASHCLLSQGTMPYRPQQWKLGQRFCLTQLKSATKIIKKRIGRNKEGNGENWTANGDVKTEKGEKSHLKFCPSVLMLVL